MATVLNNVSVTGGGISIAKAVARTADGGITYNPTLAVAYGSASHTLSTRTSDTAGTLTVPTGHDITTGAVFDIYWTSAGVKYVAYGATAGTVSAAPSNTSIPFTGATGDALPAQDTQVTICKQITVNTNIDGDALSILAIEFNSTLATQDVGAHIRFLDSGSSEVAELDFSTNSPRVWDITGGDTNDFTGNPITSAKVSHANVTAGNTITLKIIGAVDVTP